jgi:cytochrome c-type biogenesis protein CcmH/NrfF
MLQKPWFKIFVWFLATLFFFLASATIISLLKPGPSESEVMNYMAGMMGAMENSIMGVMMGIESDSTLKTILIWTITTLPLGIIFSIIIGFIIRKRNSEDKHV